MRNLSEYPITKSELLEYVTNLIDDLTKSDDEIIFGDVRPLYLQIILDLLSEKKDLSIDWVDWSS